MSSNATAMEERSTISVFLFASYAMPVRASLNSGEATSTVILEVLIVGLAGVGVGAGAVARAVLRLQVPLVGAGVLAGGHVEEVGGRRACCRAGASRCLPASSHVLAVQHDLDVGGAAVRHRAGLGALGVVAVRVVRARVEVALGVVVLAVVGEAGVVVGDEEAYLHALGAEVGAVGGEDLGELRPLAVDREVDDAALARDRDGQRVAVPRRELPQACWSRPGCRPCSTCRPRQACRRRRPPGSSRRAQCRPSRAWWSRCRRSNCTTAP